MCDDFSIGSMITCWEWPDEGSRPAGWNRDLLQVKTWCYRWGWKYYWLILNAKITLGFLGQYSISSYQSEASWVTEIKIFPIVLLAHGDVLLFHCPWHGSYHFHFHFVRTECFIDTRLWNRLWACFHGNTLARLPWQINWTYMWCVRRPVRMALESLKWF